MILTHPRRNTLSVSVSKSQNFDLKFVSPDVNLRNGSLHIDIGRFEVTPVNEINSHYKNSDNQLTLPKIQPLERSQSFLCRRRWFGGVIDDISNRYFKFYRSDFQDALNVQCAAAIIFIGCAQIAGSIAFGGLLSNRTENYIGISETLLASGIGGFIFSFLAGQPILIVGTTGPLLLYDSSLLLLCKSLEIDFLSLRPWIGIWLLLIAIIFASFEMSNLIHFVTRFTQEIFATMISILFVADSIYSLYSIYISHPISRTYGLAIYEGDSINNSIIISGPPESNQPNTALFSTILMFGTFVIAWILRDFRNSIYFTKSIRNWLANFSAPIAIILMVLLSYLVQDIVTKKLYVPQGFQPTFQRNWLINPTNVVYWAAIASALPAFLLFVLIFMEVAISELVVSKKENKLVKGNGLHLDVLLISVINTIICFFGLPFVSVAIVRCVTHVSSLTVWSKSSDGKPIIVGVLEQRLTNVILSILTGAAVAMAPIWAIMPLAVIFGIFFFMGVSSMTGIQLLDRVSLFFLPVESHPKFPYVQKVGISAIKLHLFTAIQLSWVALLWGIKYTRAALAFPFILIIIVPFRYFVLPLWFSSEELEALDPTGESETKTPSDQLPPCKENAQVTHL